MKHMYVWHKDIYIVIYGVKNKLARDQERM